MTVLWSLGSAEKVPWRVSSSGCVSLDDIGLQAEVTLSNDFEYLDDIRNIIDIHIVDYSSNILT